MTLSELIAAYGDNIVKWQKVDDSASSIDWGHKKGTKIVIHTEEPIGPNGMQKFGIVMWMDRERLQKILDAEKAKK